MRIRYPLIQRRKNRQTGEIISVWRPGTQADHEEGYIVLVESVGTYISASTRKEAVALAANPLLWCPYCQATDANR